MCNRDVSVFRGITSCPYICVFVAHVAAYIISTSAHHFAIQFLLCSHCHRTRRFRCRFPYQPARSPSWTPRVSPGHPCEDEHRKMRVIKGKIFLCPVIGGCRGNTRATSASNYFQTLRIERALPRAGIARHIHFSVSPTSPSSNHLRFFRSTLLRHPHFQCVEFCECFDDWDTKIDFTYIICVKKKKKERGAEEECGRVWKKKKRERGKKTYENV